MTPATFPFIHPGPVNAWAGHATHTFNIEFELADVPPGHCLLQIGLCCSSQAHPLRFTVRLNEGEPKAFATGRDRTIQKMSYVVRQGVLRKGANVLAIENAEGSWFQYDGLALFAYADSKIPDEIHSLTVEDTVFFKEEKGSLLQVLHVGVDGPWDGAGTLHVEVGGTCFSVDASTAAIKDSGITSSVASTNGYGVDARPRCSKMVCSRCAFHR